MSSLIFPTLQSENWKLTRTPVWATQTQTDSTGIRRRAALRDKPRWRWTLKNAVLQSASSIADLQTIQDFFNARAGMLDSFLWADPEPNSMVSDPAVQLFVGGKYYWPVAFTVDSLDFERFAYQLWQCGSVSFSQVDPTEAQIFAGASASLSIWTAYTSTSSAGNAGMGISLNSGATWTGTYFSGDSTFGLPLGTYGLLHTTIAVPGFATISGFRIRGYCVGTTTGTGPDYFDIYDILLTVTFADGTVGTYKPSATELDANGANGTSVTPELAFDADTPTPATFGRVTRNIFSGFSDPAYLSFKNWVAG